MRLVTRYEDPRLQRIALFQKMIPVTAGIVGLVLIALGGSLGLRAWAPILDPIVTLCVIIVPASLLFSVALMLIRNHQDKRQGS